MMGFLEEHGLYACFQCGKCTGGCPVSLRTSLNVRRLIRELVISGGLESVLSKPEIWDCTTCATCTLRCPRGLKPSDVLVSIRAELVERGTIPKTVMDALEATYMHGNPWGRARAKRTGWIKGDGLKVKVLSKGEKVSVLYFVGCAPSYDTRLQGLPVVLSQIMAMSGLDWGILGTRESCCGNEIRRMGELGLFEVLLEENTKSFKESGANVIVTTSPHCYNTFKNEYGLEGVEVLHYSQFLERLIKDRVLKFSRGVRMKVAYHDPCFLGKQNGIYESPREVLRAIPGLELVEFERSREISLCCEGGGGRMWVDGTGEGERSSEVRIKDAHEMGVDVVATACPFCLLNLEDGAKTTGLDSEVKVMDILEIVAEALCLNQS